jgi:hypothetical protein
MFADFGKLAEAGSRAYAEQRSVSNMLHMLELHPKCNIKSFHLFTTPLAPLAFLL